MQLTKKALSDAARIVSPRIIMLLLNRVNSHDTSNQDYHQCLSRKGQSRPANEPRFSSPVHFQPWPTKRHTGFSPQMACPACLDCLQQLKYVLSRDEEAVTLLHQPTIVGLKAAAEANCCFCDRFWSQYSSVEKLDLVASDGDLWNGEQPANFPDSDDDSDEAWKLRGIEVDRYATLCCIMPAQRLLGDRFNGGITFSVSLNQTRKLPSTGLRDDMYTLLLQPVDSSTPADRSAQLIDQERSGNISNPAHAQKLLSPNTADAEAWSTAEEWIATCVGSHTQCNAMAGQSWFPTRLLDLQGDGKRVRLVESAQDSSERYMTLSHRWGDSHPLALYQSTYSHMRNGISLDDMPRTFRDAVAICKRLHVRYLWIDAFCIMQDQEDHDDWIKEAALMHKVYSHSFLNLSALAAVDSDHSFFAERTVRSLRGTRLSTALRDLRIGLDVQQFEVVDVFFWQKELSNAHLNLRAWVLQERLLAPRVLHFGASQLMWECCELDASECYPEGLPSLMSSFASVRFKNLDADFHYARTRDYDPERRPELAPYRLWTRIVEAYCKCDLTKAEDKLIALSGIAKRMTAIVKDEYIAGMWRRYLASELLWEVEEQRQVNNQPSRRPEQYRAPSFSWASVDGITSPGSASIDGLLIQVLQVELDFVTDDRTGLVKGGSLLLSGKLQKLALKRVEFADYHSYAMSVNGIEVRNSEGPEWKRMGPLVSLDEHEDYFDPAERSDLCCMPARLWGDDEVLHILLLSPVDAEQGTYRRFGLATAKTQHEIGIIRTAPATNESLGAIDRTGDLWTIRLI